jgi:hypothetical protein
VREAEIDVSISQGRPRLDVAYRSPRGRQLQQAAAARELKQSF